MYCYKAPHVLRCKQNDDGCFPNDGFHIVGHGIIELEENVIKIYDAEVYGSSAVPALTIHFTSITAVKFATFRSQESNYRGGVVRLDGVFDRQVRERLTFKMSLDEYSNLRIRLKALLQGV